MKAILAVDDHGGIGKDNGLPWPRIPVDLKRFKDLTTNQVVVMGRKTWESTDMPRPLPNRTNLVVTTKNIELPPGALRVPNIQYFEHFNLGWVIGGAELFSTLFDLIEEIHLSRVPGNYHCDTFVDLEKIHKHYELVHLQKYPDHTYEIHKRKI